MRSSIGGRREIYLVRGFRSTKLACDAIGRMNIDEDDHEKVGSSVLADEDRLTMMEYVVAGALVTTSVVAAFSDLRAAVVTCITSLVTAVSS